MEIKKKEIKREDLEKLDIDISKWSPWDCEPSEFDWEYSGTETAYVFEGDVEVTVGGKTTVIKGGELVQFPDGMKCRWKVNKTIRKVYTFNKVDF